ncbi:MAG TPA: phytase [Vicinamibacterales bacterium]|nr:phytase [Vicinamibacterales bacterium]
MSRLVMVLILFVGTATTGVAQTVVQPVLRTAPLFNYEDAPATPDADDPAIWINLRNHQQSLIIGTAKDAGLLAYDLSGNLVQALFPPNAPLVGLADPATPAGLNSDATPCVDSASGETFGRYNNVDVAYDVRLGNRPGAARVDVAIVSDRGCDRVRFFEIDPSDPDGPLVDITARNVPRVFPRRYEQPSVFQPSGAVEGWIDNPVDDQNTVYGLTVVQGQAPTVFVTERERGLIRQLVVEPAQGGTLSYHVVRTFLFDTSFDLRDEHSVGYAWTPCREAALEEPQSEGLVVDSVNDTLFVAFETIGLYKLPRVSSLPAFVTVGKDRLIDPVKTFGVAYHAIPDDDEFECEYAPEDPPEPGDVVATGSDANAGQFLEADLEGLSVITSVPGQTLMLASSQGDSSFHFYLIGGNARHLGSFLVDGVGDTDGVHYVPVPLGRQYPLGLLVVQNGEAPEPPTTDPVNGFEFDGSTQFLYIDFVDALKTLGD